MKLSNPYLEKVHTRIKNIFFLNNDWNRGSYTSGHFIWNDHECKILFIIWPFESGFYRISSGHYVNRKRTFVTDVVMMLHVCAKNVM